MVSDESSPLRVNIFGEAGHIVIRVFAHLIHCVTWKNETASSALVGGQHIMDMNQVTWVLKQPYTFLMQAVSARQPGH